MFWFANKSSRDLLLIIITIHLGISVLMLYNTALAGMILEY